MSWVPRPVTERYRSAVAFEGACAFGPAEHVCARFDETLEKLLVAGESTGSVADVPVRVTWERLRANDEAILIDVRTRSEWAFVGLPDLGSLGRRPVLAEWLTFPENRINADFVAQLTEQLEGMGASRKAELYFICRSGGRSRQAALAMTAAGWESCHNVAEGFEGPLDAERHRGTQSGWKAEGLPWLQG